MTEMILRPNPWILLIGEGGNNYSWVGMSIYSQGEHIQGEKYFLTPGMGKAVNIIKDFLRYKEWCSCLILLFCFVLFCFVLFCFVLFCFVLFFFCFVLFCFVFFSRGW